MGMLDAENANKGKASGTGSTGVSSGRSGSVSGVSGSKSGSSSIGGSKSSSSTSAGPGRGSSPGGSTSGPTSGSGAPGGGADDGRGSQRDYGGSPNSGPALGGGGIGSDYAASARNTPARSSTGGIGSDYAASSRTIGGGLYSSAGVTPSFRSSEIASMASLDQMRAADMAAQHRAAENQSMVDLGTYRSTDLASKARAAENTSMRDLAVENTLSAIRKAEAGLTNPYGRLVGAKKGYNPPSYADLQNMTVGEVMAYQKSMLAAGHLSTAVGAYQVKASTLGEMVSELGIDLNTPFNEATQDKIAKGLIDRRTQQSVIDGAVSPDRLAQSLAKEWASFQTSSGLGHYDDDGVNHASVPYSEVRSLAGSLVDYNAVTPRSQVANTSNGLPATTSAIPTTRASFGEKYLGETTQGGLFTGNGLPARMDVTPTARPGSLPGSAPVPTGRPPSPAEVSYAAMEAERAKAFSSRPAPSVGLAAAAGTPTAGYDRQASDFDQQSIDEARQEQAPRSFADKYLSGTTVAGRPDVPVGGLPAARTGTTVAGRPDAPIGSMPAARQQTTVAGRPDTPVGSLPAARQGTTVAGRPDAPVGSLPAARQQTTVAGRPDAPVGSLPASRTGTTVTGRPDVPVGSLPAARTGTTVAGRPDVPVGSLPASSLSGPPTSIPGSPNVSSLERALGNRAELEYAKDIDMGPGNYAPAAPTPADDVVTQTPGYETETPAFPSTTPNRSRSPAPAKDAQEEVDSLGEQVLAGGLDVLGGLIPGVGTAISVANVGLMLTGNKTIGQRLADAIFSGDNQYEPGSTPQREGSGDGKPRRRRSSDFASKYLRPAVVDDGDQVDQPSEDTPWLEVDGRPTPKQKWVDARNTYAGA